MLQGKNIIVTGGGSGIGRATSIILAKAGAAVLVADYNEAGAAETAAQIVAGGGQAVARRVNVAVEEEVAAMVATVLERFGTLHGAFNNAGIAMQNKLTEDLTIEDWNKVADVNINGTFFCMKHEIRAMRQSGGGAIVNTASANGVVGNPYSTDYVASKHAVVGATRGAACEASITNVRVNAVLPGIINTPMMDGLMKDPHFKPFYDRALARHTIGRFGEPEDVGYAVKWLLSDEAGFVNGAAIAVDGGYASN